jgi:pimeloyl-ACP methyl ester carboxylesterase
MLRWFYSATLLIILAVVGYFPLSTFWRETRELGRMNLFKGHLVKTRDGTMYTQILGYAEQPTIVLIPGSPGWSETWKPTMRYLTREGFRTVALDIPPFGLSTSSTNYSRQAQAVRISDTVDSLKIKKLILVAQGDGVPAALAAAKLIGPRVRGLIIVSAELGWPEVKGGIKKQPSSLFLKALQYNLARRYIASVVTQKWYLTSVLKKEVYQPARITQAEEMIYEMPLTYKGTNKKIASWLVSHYLPRDQLLAKDMSIYRSFRMPTLLIWGDRDIQSPPWQAKLLKELIPNSRLTIFSDVGHLPQLENEKAFGETLFRFISNIELPVKI